MTLPTTSLSFSALQTEYGGSNPISLSEYVRGGTYVPSGTTSAYGTIPTSNNNINLGVFRGTQNVVYLDTQTVSSGSTLVIAGDFSYVHSYWGYGANAGPTSGNPFGSISDGTSNIYGGASIWGIYYVDFEPNNSGSLCYMNLVIQGSRNRTSWTTMDIAGNTYGANDGYFFNYGSYSIWYWDDYGDNNPFLIGGDISVTWI